MISPSTLWQSNAVNNILFYTSTNFIYFFKTQVSTKYIGKLYWHFQYTEENGWNPSLKEKNKINGSVE